MAGAEHRPTWIMAEREVIAELITEHGDNPGTLRHLTPRQLELRLAIIRREKSERKLN